MSLKVAGRLAALGCGSMASSLRLCVSAGGSILVFYVCWFDPLLASFASVQILWFSGFYMGCFVDAGPAVAGPAVPGGCPLMEVKIFCLLVKTWHVRC